MAVVILTPTAAAEAICHEEQLRIWTDDMVHALVMEGDFLKDDLDYSALVDLDTVVARALKSIIQQAFDHPEARTIKRTE